MIPEIEDVISHSLCYEELMFDVFDGGYACKDLFHLAENRTINIQPDADEDEHHAQKPLTPCEVIVVDVLDSQECSDPRYITYFSAQ